MGYLGNGQCREAALSQVRIVQNEANSPESHLMLTTCRDMSYHQKCGFRTGKNKANCPAGRRPAQAALGDGGEQIVRNKANSVAAAGRLQFG